MERRGVGVEAMMGDGECVHGSDEGTLKLGIGCDIPLHNHSS